jgi:hypothetical protein
VSEDLSVDQTGNGIPAAVSTHPLSEFDALRGRQVIPITHCGSCGVSVGDHAFALTCRPCGRVLTQDSDMTERARPDALLPFTIDEDAARAAFASWVTTRRFAPRALKGTRQPTSIDGVFVPFWRFSTNTSTSYSGKRGVTRHRTVTRTRTNTQGQTESYTERQPYTEWHKASGHVSLSFPGLLRPACSPLPKNVPPWPLENVPPYTRGASGGRRVIAYDIEPGPAFAQARAGMHQQIERAVRKAIGGDHQRIRDSQTVFTDSVYALVLLPAWLITYRHGKRKWPVLVNGSSGGVVGRRPYSGTKILLLVTVLAVAAVVAFLLLNR